MPIIDLQKRARELGRIRIGHQVTGTSKAGKTYTRPAKLDKFRLTSASKPLLEKVAELYGGTVNEWTPKGGTGQYEVLTESARIPILVPPQPVSQWLETWSAAGCIHRCDGATNALTGDPCDPDDPAHQEARPTTRLNVVLRDVEGIGVWRLESHGWNAAIELPNAADFLAQAGGYIEGHLALEERTSIGTNTKTGAPETRRFMVPIIEISVTPAQLLAGEGAIRPPQVEGPVTTMAIESARPDYAALAATAGDIDAVRDLWKAAQEAGHLTDALKATLTARVNDLQPSQADAPADEVVEAELVDDDPQATSDLWAECLKVGGELGIGLWDLEGRYSQENEGLAVSDATAESLMRFLDGLRQEAAA